MGKKGGRIRINKWMNIKIYSKIYNCFWENKLTESTSECILKKSYWRHHIWKFQFISEKLLVQERSKPIEWHAAMATLCRRSFMIEQKKLLTSMEIMCFSSYNPQMFAMCYSSGLVHHKLVGVMVTSKYAQLCHMLKKKFCGNNV